MVSGLASGGSPSGQFEYKDLGAIEIKGFAMPVMAPRVLRESAVQSRFGRATGQS